MSTTDEYARAMADKAVEQLLQKESLPPEVVHEGGTRLMVKGTSSAVRRSGLLILEEVSWKALARCLGWAPVTSVRQLNDTRVEWSLR